MIFCFLKAFQLLLRQLLKSDVERNINNLCKYFLCIMLRSELPDDLQRFTSCLKQQCEANELSGEKVQKLIKCCAISLRKSDVTALDLSSERAKVNDDFAVVLMRALSEANICLRSLSLRSHLITDPGFESICAYISSTKTVENLDLEGNDIAGTNLSLLRLQNADCTLRTLNLSHNPLGLTTGMAIAHNLRVNKSLTEINLNSCSFEQNVIIALATTLRQNTTLELLSIDRPVIHTRQEDGTDHFSRLLGGSSTRLRTLSMRYHGIADFGTRLLATSLRTNCFLTHLDLERNKIGTSGCEAIASHLIMQPQGGAPLSTLLLSFNNVGDEGAIALAEAISVNKSLKVISLKNNSVHEDGLMALGKALLSTVTMRQLSLFGNSFSPKAGDLFQEVIRKTDVSLDVSVYVVDGVASVAEN